MSLQAGNHGYPVISNEDQLKILKPYLPDNPVILEAGAFNGHDSVNFIKTWPQSQIYCFEPVSKLYEEVLQNVSMYYPKIQSFPYALGDKEGDVELFVSSFNYAPEVPTASSSVLAPKEHLNYASHVIFPRTEKSRMVTIDGWAQEHAVDHVDLLWLDMQGYELNALMHGQKILSTVKAISIEVEFVEAYKGQYLYQDIKTWLEAKGFHIIAIVDYGWFGDALFVRN